MRAAVRDQYGPPEVLHVAEVPTPSPKPDQVQVRVHAAGVNSADARIRGANFPRGFGFFARLAFGLRRPRQRILGNTFSGEVSTVGAAVTGFAVGDEVCGMTGGRLGTYAEFVTIAADKLCAKPAAASHDQAAAVLFGGTTALWFLRDQAKLQPGARLLVHGASGAIGSSAVQLGKHVGAEVTAVTRPEARELVTRLGADHVIDRTTTSVTDGVERYDVVSDTGGHLSPPAGRRLLAEGGVLLLAAADLPQTLQSIRYAKTGTTPERPADYAELMQLVANGDLEVAIEQVYELDDIATAHRRVDEGGKAGNLVVRPSPTPGPAS
ncbi:NAD(P)-dependent alcohol dehydrogenase [Microlunatus sp. Y2014]|uniref:NAD(P)-dependent alcohol dehydrogenase n=1 Tax=Microlunatus sp. Y2014 TaxID=3418488 RepID=UPI003DA6F152